MVLRVPRSLRSVQEAGAGIASSFGATQKISHAERSTNWSQETDKL